MTRLLWFLGSVAAVILAGVLYQRVGAWADKRRGLRELAGGRLVRMSGGRRVYVRELGRRVAGQPVVVFEAGMVVSGLSWDALQVGLAGDICTFAYDRPGLGWSGAPRGPRTPGVLAEELHELLEAAGLESPYVFVAHSYGVMTVRAFVARYGEEVVGVVLLDPMRTEGWLPTNGAGMSIVTGGAKLMRRGWWPTRLGLGRVAARSLLRPTRFSTWMYDRVIGAAGQRQAVRMTRELVKMPAAVQPAIVAHWSLPGFYEGCAAYIQGISATVAEIQTTAVMEAVPMEVLLSPASPATQAEYAHYRGDLVREWVVAGASHWIYLDEPGVVMDAVRRVASGAGLKVHVDANAAVAA